MRSRHAHLLLKRQLREGTTSEETRLLACHLEVCAACGRE